ncbi:hypothetical protein [uncultured Robinsoniella sp.]|uniref:hypothetical protein n=1 Tax=uncultured Robinsoniella sp. TaxID=904190 RepID=UPI00205D86C5|nr:MAG TPA: hypothetical protein [Caudoviricetes sp.]
MLGLEVKEIGQITGMGFIGTETGIFKMKIGKKNVNLIEGATPPLSVSSKWVRMRGDGIIAISGDYFIFRNNGTSDWIKWYYPLPENVTKIRVTLKACADEITTSPEAILSISKGTTYDDSNTIYNTKSQSGWVDISREILLPTPYIGFLMRGWKYVTGEMYVFKIKDLVVEKIE